MFKKQKHRKEKQRKPNKKMFMTLLQGVQQYHKLSHTYVFPSSCFLTMHYLHHGASASSR